MAAERLPEERYRYSFNRSLEAVKAAVKVVDEADWLCGPGGQKTGLRRVGDRWVGLCPLPDHEEKTPSFTVYPDDHWWCFGCNRGGDVLDLHQLAHGYAEKGEALVSLATERGVELPGRTERWHEATGRKVAYRELALEVVGEILCRRTFRTLVLPFIDLTDDPAQREQDLEQGWERWQRGWGRHFWPDMAAGVLRGDEQYLRAIARLKVEADVARDAS